MFIYVWKEETNFKLTHYTRIYVWEQNGDRSGQKWASRSPVYMFESRMETDQARNEPVVVQSEWSES
jgi:hypothetical protein